MKHIALGHGSWIINFGTFSPNPDPAAAPKLPALFLEPSPHTGVVGSTPPEGTLPSTNVHEDGVVITFANAAAWEVFLENIRKLARDAGFDKSVAS